MKKLEILYRSNDKVVIKDTKGKIKEHYYTKEDKIAMIQPSDKEAFYKHYGKICQK